MSDDDKASSPTTTPATGATGATGTTTPPGSGATGTAAVHDAPSKAPGWYPAPHDTNSEIYWDGDRFHGSRTKDLPSSGQWRERWERFKRGFAREKWAWLLFAAFLPLIGTVTDGVMKRQTEAEQAQKALTQSQERDAYIGFYESVDEFVEAVWAEARRWEPGDTGATITRLAAPMKENLGTSMNNVLTAESKVTFYGSEATQQAANDVVEQVAAIQGSLSSFEIKNPQYPNLSDVQAAEFRKTIGQIGEIIRGKLQGAHLAFRRAARADLGLPRADDDIYNPLYDPGPRTPAAAPAPPPPIYGKPRIEPAPPAASPAPPSLDKFAPAPPPEHHAVPAPSPDNEPGQVPEYYGPHDEPPTTTGTPVTGG